MAVANLCQRGRASCGACCGLYNRRAQSAPAIRALLARRTGVLASVPKTPESFRRAARDLAAAEEPALFPSLRVCPLLGFLDRAQTRIGCLAHPSSTGGPDLRDCGSYDRDTCEGFFCSAHEVLSEAEADLAAEICTGDPVLYGLVVTDAPFLRAALEAAALASGRPLTLGEMAAPPLREALRSLVALKEELAAGSAGLFTAFEPSGEERPEARDPETDSAEARLLACLGADPRSGNDLDRLEALIRARLSACAAAAGHR